jgi:hypothetical protein
LPALTECPRLLESKGSARHGSARRGLADWPAARRTDAGGIVTSGRAERARQIYQVVRKSESPKVRRSEVRRTKRNLHGEH